MLRKRRHPQIEMRPAQPAQGYEHLAGESIAVLTWLQANQVEFVLVGPVAEAIRGGGGSAGPVAIVPAPYRRNYERLSRALLDRFDLALTVPRSRGEELAAPPGEASEPVRDRVEAARSRLAIAAPSLSCAADDLLTRAVERLPLSGRGRARVATVAATVAALSASDTVAVEHLAEALSYRPPQELTA